MVADFLLKLCKITRFKLANENEVFVGFGKSRFSNAQRMFIIFVRLKKYLKG
jgi:hypothetical protein